MTDKLDIPALAGEMKAMAAFYMERPCVPDGFPLALTDMSDRERKAVASLLLRATAAITTALEIGRAMGMSQAAEMHDKWAAGCDEGLAHCIEVFHTPGQWYEQKSYHQDSAKYIREAAPAVDLEGLTERIARVIASDLDGGEEQYWERYLGAAGRVLSSLGLNAREN